MHSFAHTSFTTGFSHSIWAICIYLHATGTRRVYFHVLGTMNVFYWCLIVFRLWEFNRSPSEGRKKHRTVAHFNYFKSSTLILGGDVCSFPFHVVHMTSPTWNSLTIVSWEPRMKAKRWYLLAGVKLRLMPKVPVVSFVLQCASLAFHETNDEVEWLELLVSAR